MAELVVAVPPLLRADQAEQRYNEAVQAAVEKCAADTAGQTCYICYGEGNEDEGLVRGCACRGGAGFAHVSCLARQAQVVAERTFDRWHTCGLCEQRYHGVVSCALGWACWKTYVGRPEADHARQLAISVLGRSLFEAEHFADALSVQEAELSMLRRLGTSTHNILIVQGNLASTYQLLGRLEEALRLKRDVYSGRMKLQGEDCYETLLTANNYSTSLLALERYQEAKTLSRRTVPVARRIHGESHDLTLSLRWNYAAALYRDPSATLDDLRVAVTTLEDVGRIAQQVLGGSHPYTVHIEGGLRASRAVLRARETPSASA